MIIALVAFGILFGGLAATATLLVGGTFLMALAAYTGVGTLGAMASVVLALWATEKSGNADWTKAEESQNPISA